MNRGVLVTGGAGYIGIHACIVLYNYEYNPIIFDNFATSSKLSIAKVEEIVGRNLSFNSYNIENAKNLKAIFRENDINYVIHFAGRKSVQESMGNPLSYYRSNVAGAINLLEAMNEAGVKKLIFSSSAAIYGDHAPPPVSETAERFTTSPYGRTKVVVESMLEDLCRSDPDWSVVALRYFNPVGAHPTGLIGENPIGSPSNLMPCIAEVAAGLRSELDVFGGDYPTPDGTAVRDYIHVMDLAEGHVAALSLLDRTTGFTPINLGVGRGVSVLELVRAFERASGRKVPYQIRARREGDIAISYANPARAEALLGWRASRGLDQMCADAWRWQLRLSELKGG